MSTEKNLMAEAAILYYEKKKTQQQIAQMLKLSRQTVSKLLGDAISEHIVEITIHDPARDCRELEEGLCKQFGLRDAVVCAVSGRDEAVCRLMTVKKAAEYLLPIIKSGQKKIGVSWGRTLQAMIQETPRVRGVENTVFPLFGATDSEDACFLSNELARNFADRIGAEVKYAWFPYRTDQEEDCALLKKTSYYKRMRCLWDDVDLAIVGIGNAAVLRLFERALGYHENTAQAVGDVATHLFTAEGAVIDQYDNTLCASVENLRHAKQTVAIACDSVENDKVAAITGALRTGLIHTLITDEHTARKVLSRCG